MSGSDSPSYNRGNFGGEEHGRAKGDAGRFFVTAGTTCPQLESARTARVYNDPSRPGLSGTLTRGQGMEPLRNDGLSAGEDQPPDRTGAACEERWKRQFSPLP